MLLAAELIRQVHRCPVPTEDTIRATTNATRTLCAWAANPKTPDSEAALVLTEALQRLREIAGTASALLANPISAGTMRELHAAIDEMRGLLVDEDDDSDSHMCGSGANNKPAAVPQPPEDAKLARDKAAFHMRIVLLVIVVILVLCTAGLYVLGSQQLSAHEEETKKEATLTMLGIAVDALDALYPKLVEAGIDVRVSGVAIAAHLLAQLSSTRTSRDSNQTMFVSPLSSLFEFRAATVNFAKEGRVTAVTTPRIYGLLCADNMTYPIHQLHDVMGTRRHTMSMPTPNQCGNDASFNGVFAGVTPPYKMYRPYVRTYRRNGARVANYYHPMFDTTIAVTYDRELLRDYAKPQATLFGVQDPLRSVYGNWKARAATWTALSLGIGLGLLMVLLEVLSVSNRLVLRAAMCAFIAAGAAGILAVVLVTLEGALTYAVEELVMSVNADLTRCVASGMSAYTMMMYDATPTLVNTLYSKTLKGSIFYNTIGSDAVSPPEMREVAEAIQANTFILFRRAQHYSVRNGYAYYAFFRSDTQQQIVVVSKLPPRFAVKGGVGVVVGGGVGTLLFLLIYVQVSPLKRLLRFATGSPFLRHNVSTENVRYIFYAVMAVAVLGTTIALDMRAVAHVSAKMVSMGKETMVVLAATIRAPSVAEVCIGSCGLPSYMVGMYFNLVNGSPHYRVADSPYPFPSDEGNVNWESRYYGAQLSLSKVPAVLEGIPAFYTPLVNRTSGIIEPATLQRRTITTANIDDNSGFSLERMTESMEGSLFRFTSKSMCTSISLVLVLGGICLLEWLYTLLRTRTLQKRGLCWVYAGMAAVVCVVSMSVLVNALVMKALIANMYSTYADTELSLLVSAGVNRLETVGLNGIDFGEERDEEKVIQNLMTALDDMSDSVQMSTHIYARWTLMQQYPDAHSTTVRKLTSDKLKSDEFMDIGPLNQGLVPQCGKLDGRIVNVLLPELKAYCYAEIPLNTSRKLFALVLREDSLVTNVPARESWWEILVPSVCAAAALLVFLLVVLFWVMHSAHAGGDAVMKLDVAITEAHSARIPRHFQMLDAYIPRAQLHLWFIATIVFLMAVLVYYCVALSGAMQDLRHAETTAVPYTTHESALHQMTSDAALYGYSFIVFSHSNTGNQVVTLSKSITDGTRNTAFLTKTNEATYVSLLGSMITTLESQMGYLQVYQQVDLVATGHASYDSLLSSRYSDYIASQKQTLTYLDTVEDWLSMTVLRADDLHDVNGVPFPVAAVDFLKNLSGLRDYTQKLFALDHVAIGTYLVFNGSADANDQWPLVASSRVESIDKMIKNVNDAVEELTNSITSAVAVLNEVIPFLFPESELGDSAAANLANALRTMETAYALADPTSDIWTHQRMRCVEALLKKDRSALKNWEQIELQLTSLMSSYDSDLRASINSEISSRKTLQLTENLRIGKPLDTERALSGMEIPQLIHNAKTNADVIVACTAIVYTLAVLVCAAWYALMRRNVRALFEEVDREETQRLSGESEKLIASSNSNETSAIARGIPAERWVVLPFLIVSLLALIPVGCAYMMVSNAARAASEDIPGQAMGLEFVLDEFDFYDSCEQLYLQSGQSYATKDDELLSTALKRFKDKATRLVNSYVWLVARTFNGETYTTELLENFQDLMEQTLEAVSAEYYSHLASLALPDQTDFSSEHGAYEVDVATNMVASDGYSKLIPMATTSTAGPLNAVAKELYDEAIKNATAVQDVNELQSMYTYYREVVHAQDRVAQAELQMWHTIICASRDDGVKVALQYSDFQRLVGPDALAPLGTSAGVTAVADYYADILDATSTRDDVIKLFTTDVEPIPSSSGSTFNAYTTTGAIAAYASSVEVEAMFLMYFAYNRLLIESSRKYDRPPLKQLLRDLLDASYAMVVEDSAVFRFVITDAQENKWIWITQMFAQRINTVPLTDLGYLNAAMRWSLVLSFWALLLVTVLLVLKGGVW